MKSKWRGALIGGIIGGLLGIIVGSMVFLGLSASVPHSETGTIAIIGFSVALVVLILLGLIFGLIWNKHKIIVIFGFIGLAVQIIFLLMNPQTDSMAAYWLTFPSVPILVSILIGVIIEKVISK